jgi:hypothetical protein
LLLLDLVLRCWVLLTLTLCSLVFDLVLLIRGFTDTNTYTHTIFTFS